MHRRTATGALLALGLTTSLWAEPTLGVHVDKGGDTIEVRLSQSAPLQNVVQRWKDNPHRFEVVVPGAELQGKGNISVDRGILQRVEVKRAGDSVLIQVYAMSKPRMSWVGSADRKTWTLRVSSSEQAASAEPPRLPGAAAPSAARPARPPVAARPKPEPVKPQPKPEPVAKVEPPKPEPVAKPEPVKPQPKPEPVAKPEPVKPQPKPEPVARPEPAARPEPVATQKPEPVKPPVAERPDQRPISVSFQNKDLPAALREIAKAGGLEADIAPGVTGKVTASFTATPLSRVVSSVLGKQEALYEYKIVGNRLQVTGEGATAGGSTLVPVTLPANPGRSARLVSDYFTLKADQPVAQILDAVRRVAAGAEVYPDSRLNVLYVRADEADLEKVRNLLRDLLVR